MKVSRRVVDQQQHDHPAEDPQPVLPGAELLLADPRQVGDRDLGLAQAAGLGLDPDLGLDVEAARLGAEPHSLRAPDRVEAGELVGTLEAVADREQLVEEPVPDAVDDRHRLRLGLPDPADQVVLVEQLDHLLDGRHRVGRVGVHDHHVLALRLGDTGADRYALAAVRLVLDQADRVALGDVGGVVVRAVVHHQDLIGVIQVLTELVEDVRERRALVVRGEDHGGADDVGARGALVARSLRSGYRHGDGKDRSEGRRVWAGSARLFARCVTRLRGSRRARSGGCACGSRPHAGGAPPSAPRPRAAAPARGCRARRRRPWSGRRCWCGEPRG